jgi:hypothetical protein
MNTQRCGIWIVFALTVLSSITVEGGDSLQWDDPTPFHLSPKYGITVCTPPLFDSIGNFQLYVVRFRMPEDGPGYELVDSFFTGFLPVECDTSNIAFMQRGTGELLLISMELESPRRRDTLIELVRPRGAGNMQSFIFRRQDSLLVLSESFTPKPRWQTTVTILKGSHRLDTLACLTDFGNPHLSGDGSEILLDTFEETREGYVVPGIGVYDIWTNSLTRPIASRFGVAIAIRSARDEPLFYIRNGPSGLGNVWCFDSLNGEQQITFLLPPEYVGKYELSEDTLWYQVMQSVGVSSGEYDRTESVSLKKIGLR